MRKHLLPLCVLTLASACNRKPPEAGAPINALADEYGVADITAGRAIKRQTWKHVA